MFDMLKLLSLACAPSGFESEVSDIITSYLESLSVKHARTPDGSVIAKLCAASSDGEGTTANRRRLMLHAQMDEAGFMVKSHSDDGYISISPLGIADTGLLVGKRVTLCADSHIRGYVGAVPVHLSKGKDKPGFDELYVDVGARNKAEAERLVPLGSCGTFDSAFSHFGDGASYVMGKTLSSRAPCAVLIDVLRRVCDVKDTLPCDLYFAFTTRGNLAISGAASVYRRIMPDAVISLTATSSLDTPECSASICRLSDGVCIPTTEINFAYCERDAAFLRGIATLHGIKTQYAAPVKASVDRDYDLLGMKSAGARLSAVRIPVRYRSSALEVMNACDITSASELLYHAVCEISL